MDPTSSGRSLLDAIDGGSTAGYISEDADHWAIEPFIPVAPDQWTEVLAEHQPGDCGIELPVEQFKQAAAKIRRSIQRKASTQQHAFATRYHCVDPDRDTRDLMANRVTTEVRSGDPEDATQFPRSHMTASVNLMLAMLDQAGYQRIDQDAIQQCVGVASHWGVPLQVDFDLFEELIVYARGDIVGSRPRRRMRKLYQREWVDVPIYQRMVVLFRMKQAQYTGEYLVDNSLHLRMFKNIPKQDIDMLLPGSKIKLSSVDRVRIVLPSLGGFLMSIRKIASYALLFAVLALHWLTILVVLIAGCGVKSVMSYFQTKNRYQLNLNRNLYFQKLDTGAGVGFHVVSQAASQSQVEATLAYFAILTHHDAISARKLKRRCQRIVRELIDVEVDFQVDRAIVCLNDLELIKQHNNRWLVTTG